MSVARCLRLEHGQRCVMPAEPGGLVCGAHAARPRRRDTLRPADRDAELREMLGRLARSIPPAVAAWPPARAMTMPAMDALLDVVTAWRSCPMHPLSDAVGREYAAAWIAWRNARREWSRRGRPAEVRRPEMVR